jgi:hypothetical protein
MDCVKGVRIIPASPAKNQIPNRIVLVVRWWCNLLQQSGT